MSLHPVVIPIMQNSSLTFGGLNREDVFIVSAAQSMHCEVRSRLEHQENFSLTGC